MEQPPKRISPRSVGTRAIARTARVGRRLHGHRRFFIAPKWQWWWPVTGAVLGIVMAIWLDDLAMESPWLARLISPWTFLFSEHVTGFRPDLAEDAVAAIGWLQLPVYGTLVMLAARRFKAMNALATVVAMHLFAFLLLVMMRSTQ